jgi:hypothetical protein
MILLKPRGRFQNLMPALHQFVKVFAKNGIRQYALDPVARDGL